MISVAVPRRYYEVWFSGICKERLQGLVRRELASWSVIIRFKLFSNLVTLSKHIALLWKYINKEK